MNKCICKKNFEFPWRTLRVIPKVLFKEDSFYTYLYLNDPGDDFRFIWVIYNEYGRDGEQGCRFYTGDIDNDKKIIVGGMKNFNDYFYTESELRKMKLKKLKLIK
jgi:hypothetical protein